MRGWCCRVLVEYRLFHQFNHASTLQVRLVNQPVSKGVVMSSLRPFVCAVSIAAVFLFLAQADGFASDGQTLGTIERLDPAFDKLVAEDARIEVLAQGFTWSEGSVWVPEETGGYVLFSDIPRNSVFKWKEGEGVSLFLRPSGYTGNAFYGLEPGCNGLLLDPQGRLVSCEHGDRRISVLTKNGGKRTLVDNYQGKRLNSPNDAVY